ncbi:restriction endonuclease [Streptomyces sp. NPDC093595]|uniref:restriction endonuclease n=1 Tax=Streptomyces sp. NPDC093595 TaxID=3366045 RepID=UPI00380FBE21
MQKGHGGQGAAATSTCTVLYDPEGVIESWIPLDRAPFEALATAVLTSADAGLPAGDCQQIALALTGHARAVLSDLHHRARLLPAGDPRRTPAEAVLDAAERHLSAPLQGTAHCVRSRAGLVRALYEQLDRLKGTSPGSVTPDSAPKHAPHRAPEAGSDTGPEAPAGQPARD